MEISSVPNANTNSTPFNSNISANCGAVLAAWRQARERGLVAASEVMVLFNCANGNKYPLADRSERLTLAEADPAAL